MRDAALTRVGDVKIKHLSILYITSPLSRSAFHGFHNHNFAALEGLAALTNGTRCQAGCLGIGPPTWPSSPPPQRWAEAVLTPQFASVGITCRCPEVVAYGKRAKRDT